MAALHAPAGEPRGRALLVPGFTGSKEDFIEVLAPLARAGYSATAIDLRGQFETPPHSSDPHTLDTLAADVCDIGSTGGKPWHVVGHSLGGLIVRHAVIDSPVLWRSVTLMDSGPAAVIGEAAESLNTIVAALPAISLEQLWQLKQAFDEQQGAAAPPAEIQRFLHHRWTSGDATALRDKAEILLSTQDRTAELASALSEHSIPALVCVGEDDLYSWSLTELRGMADRLHAEWSIVEGAGHSPAAEHPEATVDLLTEFWSRCL